MPTTPLLLVDSVFDRINQYRAATLTALSEVVGHEARRVAGYRRDRQSWQAASDGGDPATIWNYVQVDLGLTVTAPVDYLYIDRGHNLWGQTVKLLAPATDGSAADPGSTEGTFVVPALGTVGGNPTTGFCVTEEGALWTIFTKTAAKRWWRVAVVNATGFVPILPAGVMLGQRTQLLGYSRVFDEDAGSRKQAGGRQESDAGYTGTGRTYAWRTLELDLAYIGATEYDGTMRTLRRLLFERNCPVVACLDYATHPERAWMFQSEDTTWGFPKSRVYRSGRLRLREMGPRLDV